MKKIITLLLGVIAFLCTACDEQTIYTKDGLICMKRYNGNAQVDREICWYEGTDQKQSEKYWKDEKEDGVWKEWYKNGQLKRETHWKEGKAEGVSKEWDENGKGKTHAEGKKSLKKEKKQSVSDLVCIVCLIVHMLNINVKTVKNSKGIVLRMPTL